ncbi:glycoside hydrolase family 44 protein [Acetivibrio clariflavus]|uniref:PDK repeat-containing protein n=1 Tax=Acetivibrio clariflavus (strain DSM 19732 / NBRC 101661 / EBR45) TaxID=720554 RepID=G8M2T6_ACECE|nr:PDK repeat-containing protein [Acetivibrio clariflavus DSM 19732]
MMNKKLAAFLLAFQMVVGSAVSNVLPVSAAQASVDVSIDTQANRLPISPYIYGVNQDLPGQTVTARRLGGNRTTAYNWENNASNAGSDYIHSSDNYLVEYIGVPREDSEKPGAVATTFHDQSLAQNVPYTLLTLQAAGYVSADKYGEVKPKDAAPSERWKEVKFAKNAPFSLTPDLTDDYVYMDEFVNFLVNKYGSASSPTGVKGYSVDNEPALWAHTHSRVHPDPVTCEELVEKTAELSKAVKNVDPDAEIFGPALYGFAAYLSLQSAPDWEAGLKDNYDWFVDYYLEKMKEKSDEAGMRLLDVFDIHYYPEARGGGSRITFGEDSSNIECNKARLQAPRTLWQGSYREDSWIAEPWFDSFRPILPRIQESINKYYPGTKLAITEYDFGAGNHITGGIAQADVLGIFGENNVYLATYWGDRNKDYIVAGINLYTNYDGKGSKYGDISVKASVSNDELASAYASVEEADDGKLHIILLNKNYDNSTIFNISINSDKQYKSGKAWGFDRASSQITQRPAVTRISNNKFTYTLPALSAYHIVLDAADTTEPEVLVGDVNKDGDINVIDYALMKKYVLGMLDEIDVAAADINVDGEVNSIDCSLMKAYLLGMIKEIPYYEETENEEPVASFTISNSEPVTDEDIIFDASDSTDPDGNIVYYAWDFGDGSEGKGKTVKHKYAKPGTYTVKLIVTDDKYANSSPATKTITVTQATGDNSEFGFEGTTQGFIVSGEKGTTATLSVTSENTFKGNGALKIDVVSADGGMFDVKLDGPSIVPPGSKVTFRVWIPSNAPLSEIQGYVMPHDPSWSKIIWNGAWGGYEYMKKDAWNELTLIMPEDTDMSLMQQIGVQFKTNDAAEFTVYVDSIDW